MKTVLLVEDEPQIAQIVRDYLRHAGYGVIMTGDGMDALTLARERQLRRESDIPIIMLTARVEESDRLIGLDLGADDYVTKPFSPRELVARVRAVLRRVEHGTVGGDILRRAGLTIDVSRMTATRDGIPIELTATELQLLATLVRQPGRVFTRGQLLDAVRGSDVESFERAIDAHIKNIRRKLEPDSRNPQYVLTVYGIGYKFAES